MEFIHNEAQIGGDVVNLSHIRTSPPLLVIPPVARGRHRVDVVTIRVETQPRRGVGYGKVVIPVP